MYDKAKFVAYNDRELMAWSMILAMNNINYYIHVDRHDDMVAYLFMTNLVDDKLYKFLKSQFDLQMSFTQPIRI